MDANELVEVINNCQHSDYWKEAVEEEFYRECYLVKELAELGYTFKNVDSYGGEGQGDDYWTVFSVTFNGETTYFELDGWYASYEGHNFDDYFGFYEVEKVAVQKYEWHKKS